jgi:ribokinase
MITVIGSSNIDYVCYTERIPELGETVAGSSFLVTAGGKGANQAVAAARLGARTVLLTKLGREDRYAGLLTDGFQAAGVDVSRVQFEPGSYCGCALIMVDRQARNIIGIVPNANARISVAYIEENRSLIEASQVLVVEFGVPLPTVEHAVALARKAGVTTLVNPAPALVLGDRFYENVDVIVPNETEAEALCGQRLAGPECLRDAAGYFHRRKAANVVITLGEKGAFVSDGRRTTVIPGRAVKVVDSTGAGDAFVGGLACALAEGRDIFAAAAFANAAAALSVTRPGAARSMPARSEVEELFQRRGADG